MDVNAASGANDDTMTASLDILCKNYFLQVMQTLSSLSTDQQYCTTDTVLPILYHQCCTTIQYHRYCTTNTVPQILYHRYCTTDTVPPMLYYRYCSTNTVQPTMYHRYCTTDTVPQILYIATGLLDSHFAPTNLTKNE